ncbi:hypothetical protein GCM10009665_32650 [Kitasatospora nipponensis]|uniref:Tyr recombinase domain-containing protein n=1 Tax=Kitasatospora nipponensis TaxID=258049 RepID=A0ABN1W7Z8_9ACTN
MTIALQPLPLVASGSSTTRTAGDRLEILTALMAAPDFDPIFRGDVIQIPGDHPVYGWVCRVTECERSSEDTSDYCQSHRTQWSAMMKEGKTLADFLRVAEPLKPRSWHSPPPCIICPEVPAWASNGLCFLHKTRWVKYTYYQRHTHGRTPDLDAWIARQPPLPGFGDCHVVSCPDRAHHPLGLCHRHLTRYERDGRPGRATLPKAWAVRKWRAAIPVEYEDPKAFDRWCLETGTARRSNGKVSLLGLRPLVKAEVQWTMFRHCNEPSGEGRWPLLWIENLLDLCRSQKVDSLADLDLTACPRFPSQVANRMLVYLRLVYFSRQDTKDAGYIETDHFGIRYRNASSLFDLTDISQRWLRDMLWDFLAARLSTSPGRSRNPIDEVRRGMVELSAFLEARAPGGGHDPTVLTADHMTDYVADHRHRGEKGLPSLGIYTTGRGLRRGRGGEPVTLNKDSVARNLGAARRVLRDRLDTGDVERIGLDRGFVIAIPHGHASSRRRRPFADDAARALANEENLQQLAGHDPDDRGLRDQWETLVFTGRRCREVLELRLDCLGRFNNLPVLWHDQTKVGNYDEAIRIPERLYERLRERQNKTVARFEQRFGRPPTALERTRIALFPRRSANRQMLHGVSYAWFHGFFHAWVNSLAIGRAVPHQARHTLATNLLRNGANLSQVKRYLGQVSDSMAEHYIHIASTDPKLTDALNAVWVAGPGAAEPGLVLSSGEPMTREHAQALAIDLTRRSTPAEGGFCTFQPVVNGDACPWNLDCHNCDKFVLSGADLVYWHRKREQWRMLAERAPDPATADFLHDAFEPTARAIDGLEKALAAVDLLDEALTLDLRRPQDYFGRIWATAFRAQELASHDARTDEEAA